MAGGIATGSWGAVLAILLPIYGRLIDSKNFEAIFTSMSLIPLAGVSDVAVSEPPAGGESSACGSCNGGIMKTMFIRAAVIVLSVATLDAQVTFDRLLHADKEPQNWLSYSGTHTSSQRYSALAQVTPGNVQ